MGLPSRNTSRLSKLIDWGWRHEFSLKSSSHPSPSSFCSGFDSPSFVSIPVLECSSNSLQVVRWQQGRVPKGHLSSGKWKKISANLLKKLLNCIKLIIWNESATLATLGESSLSLWCTARQVRQGFRSLWLQSWQNLSKLRLQHYWPVRLGRGNGFIQLSWRASKHPRRSRGCSWSELEGKQEELWV